MFRHLGYLLRAMPRSRGDSSRHGHAWLFQSATEEAWWCVWLRDNGGHPIVPHLLSRGHLSVSESFLLSEDHSDVPDMFCHGHSKLSESARNSHCVRRSKCAILLQPEHPSPFGLRLWSNIFVNLPGVVAVPSKGILDVRGCSNVIKKSRILWNLWECEKYD